MRRACKAYLEKFGRTSVDADTLSLVEVSFVVLFRDALGMTCSHQSVVDVRGHIEFRCCHFNLRHLSLAW